MKRIQVLKYLVLTTMLVESDINPFDSQETKPYKNDPRISAMTDLVDAYQRDDIHRYSEILQNNTDVLEDPFIAENIDEVTRNMRTKAVLKLVASYTRFTLSFIAKQLQISPAEVQDIVGYLVLDKKLKASIDEVQGIVNVEHDADAARMHAMASWTSAVEGLGQAVLNDGNGFRVDESSLSVFATSALEFPEGKMTGSRIGGGWVKAKGGQKRSAGHLHHTSGSGP